MPHGLFEGRQSGRDVLSEMHAQHPPVALGKHLEIAPRFSRLDDAEHVFPVRHLEIERVVTGDLQESACTVLRAAAGRKVSTKNAAPP
jgi:hypothetical protein